MKKLITIFSILLILSLAKEANAVPFKLVNKSLRKITLEIPGVMNPNLDRMSHSGVDLEVGQQIYFYHNGKRVLLLEVDETVRNKKIDVRQLIKSRIKELGE